MNLTVLRLLPALLLLIAASASGGPAAAQTKPAEHRRPAPPPGIQKRLDLYAPRVRRSTITYLRLRLLELHEEGLDRARAAIERRLSIDEMLEPQAAAVPDCAPDRVPCRHRRPGESTR